MGPANSQITNKNLVQRSFALTSHICGPGADKKYTSQEQREKEQHHKAKQKKQKLIGSAILGGAIAGSLWGYLSYTNKKKDEVIGNDQGAKQYLLSQAPPQFKPARVIKSAVDKPQNFKITLFQYQTCPFCCKARAFLDYFGLAYDVIEVNSVMRKEVKWSQYKKVPIVVVEFGDKVIQVNDSTAIVSALYSLFGLQRVRAGPDHGLLPHREVHGRGCGEVGDPEQVLLDVQQMREGSAAEQGGYRGGAQVEEVGGRGAGAQPQPQRVPVPRRGARGIQLVQRGRALGGDLLRMGEVFSDLLRGRRHVPPQQEAEEETQPEG